MDSGTIATGSVSQVFEVIHYYRSLRLYKEGFDAVVQNRVEDTTNKYEHIHLDLLSNLSELRKRPSSKALEHIANMKEYKELVSAV